jgi:hypothetical protein
MVGIKLNSVEFHAGGFSAEECSELCNSLENEGQFDFVELSGGTYEQLAFGHKRESTKKREAFFLEFAEKIVPGLKKTKTYITGGLRTVGAMVKTLETVDGVGFARPVCQEFHFCKDILEGKITGAIDQKLDQNNFGLTNVAAGTQIRQVGKDEEPIDLSKDENVQAFMKDMGTWGQKMQEDAASMNLRLCGYSEREESALRYCPGIIDHRFAISRNTPNDAPICHGKHLRFAVAWALHVAGCGLILCNTYEKQAGERWQATVRECQACQDLFCKIKVPVQIFRSLAFCRCPQRPPAISFHGIYIHHLLNS